MIGPPSTVRQQFRLNGEAPQPIGLIGDHTTVAGAFASSQCTFLDLDSVSLMAPLRMRLKQVTLPPKN
jgi:hypothetical protein